MHRLLLLIFTIVFLTVDSNAQDMITRPECVDYDSVNSRYLVSCWSAGRIIAIDSNSEQSIFWSTSSQQQVLSNTISGSTFYVSNRFQPGYVAGVDLATGDELFNIPIIGSAQLDGMAADTSGFLYVIDNGPGRRHLFRIDLSDNSYIEYISSGLADRPQDIIHDPEHNRLLVVGYTENAPIQAISLPDGKITTLVTTPMGFFDGIAIDNYGNLYVSSYSEGAVYRYDRTLTNPPKLIADGFNGSANIDYDCVNDILAVPEFNGNNVELIPILGGPQLGGTEFSDDLYGDGDGYMESGETIELTVSIANNSRDLITDLTVTLFCEDASFHIVNETVNWEDVTAEDTVNNGGSPMIIEIPADYPVLKSKFYLEATWNNVHGLQVDTLIIRQIIGKVAMLIIDDDDGDDIDFYYRETLDNLCIPYDHWDASTLVPDSTDLNLYEIVVWLTGDFRMWPMTTDKITAMKGFMDGGGKLFLTGQRISSQLNGLDPDFLHNYLKVNHVSSGVVATLVGQTGGQLFAPDDLINILGDGGANNQTSCDQIAAINGSIAEFNYYGSADQGAVSYSGDYQMVFFSFGFEAIVNGDSPRLEREEVLGRILDFFGYSMSASSMNLSVSPGEAMHLVDHTPEIGWAHATPDYVQQEYRVQVGTDNEWSTIEMWDYGPMTSTETNAVYDGLELLDGQSYYFRIMVSDGSAWSIWYYGRMRMNSLPTAPTDLSPDGMVEMPDGAPLMANNNASDVEGDALTYSYEVYNDVLLTSLAASASDQPEGSGAQSTWIIDPAVEPGEEYYWRVRAEDGYESGAWSLTASFSVKATYIDGDANGDEVINVGDAVALINYVFKGGPAPYPLEAGDADCNEAVNVGDAVYLINFVFKGGPEPGADCL
ncbi:MAG: hypothetical protein GY841_04675 [FCB group bacterium]|nr:hypothetical protein [FCB group bacterium]